MEEDDASYGDDFFPEVNITVRDAVTGDRDNVFLGGDRYRGANLINVESEFLTLKALRVRNSLSTLIKFAPLYLSPPKKTLSLSPVTASLTVIFTSGKKSSP